MTRAGDLQHLIAEEPFVRALATSLCAGEADDVVQQAYLRAIQSRPGVLARPRHWLARIVRNLASDFRRQQVRLEARHTVAYENATRDACVPSSAALLEAEEARRELVAAVDALPELQRTVVLLRYYDGLPPRRIASRLGVPAATVRHRLHEALQTLRRRLDARHGGDRPAWLLPLVPFATSPRSLPWHELTAPAAKNLSGAIVTTTKTKFVAALGSLLVLTLVWVAWPGGDLPSDHRPASAPAAQTVARGDLGPAAPAAATTGEAIREAADAPKLPEATTGTLLVRARYADEPTVAAGVAITILRSGDDFRVGLHRTVTDAEGLARFDSLPPGNWRVGTVHTFSSVQADVAAGSTCECTLPLRGGFTLAGLVVDASGAPVGGAIVETAIAIPGVDAGPIAVTDADGAFTIRECFVHCNVGARAEGHAASVLYSVEGTPGRTERVRIELRPDGGAVEGLVLGPSGEPVAGAVVRVGEGRTESFRQIEPLPAQVRTDAAGRFRAIGVPFGTQPVQVRAVNLSPWRGTCDVAAGTSIAMRIMLAASITCTGIVRGESGEPAPGAEVQVGAAGDFLWLRVRSGPDGGFALTGVPPGDFEVVAELDRAGKATARLNGQPGETVRCELQLTNGRALRARVLDAAGAPLSFAEVRVLAEGEGAPWSSGRFTGKDGRVVILDCPPGRTLALLASKQEHVTVRQSAVQPGGPELELRLQRDNAAKARITGRLLRPDGSPAAGETVDAIRFQTRTEAQLRLEATVGGDGSFVIEVPAGEWTGFVRVKGHPDLRFTPGKLDGGAWDAGVLRLTAGGTLVVRVDSTDAKTDSYTVLDLHEHAVCSIWSPVTPLRSDLIAPGDYLLLAQIEGVIPQVLPFTIHEGQESTITVPRQPGVRQCFEFELTPGTERPPYVAFEVRRGSALAASTAARGEPRAPFRRELCLAPGSYTLATKNREPQTTATFTVGATEGPPLRIVVR